MGWLDPHGVDLQPNPSYPPVVACARNIRDMLLEQLSKWPVHHLTHDAFFRVNQQGASAKRTDTVMTTINGNLCTRTHVHVAEKTAHGLVEQVRLCTLRWTHTSV